MRTNLFLGLALCALVTAACEEESSNVGANPSAGSGGSGVSGAAGQPGAGAGGDAGSGGTAGTAGAAGTGGTGPGLELAVSELPRFPAEQASEADRNAVAQGNNQFAVDLYGQLRADPKQAAKNLWFSPLSISMALGMTSAGAKGATQSDLAKALRFTLPQEKLHPALNRLSLELAQRPEQAKAFAAQSGANNVPDVALTVVNSVWGERTLTWEKPFLDVLAQNYGTGVYLADYKNKAEQERLAINGWVAEKTQQRILDLLAPGTVNEMTRMVLVNAVNFTFPWDKPFDPKDTKDGSFGVVGGAPVSVPMMAQLTRGTYAEDAVAQVAAVPLFGGRLSLVTVLPKEGKFEELEGKLGEELEALQGAAQDAVLDLTYPKFRFTTESLSLRNQLKALGMKAPFEGGADFSAMSKDSQIQVSDVLHKAMVGVDEVGVEAAAATAVVLEGGAPPPTPTVFTVNRSFLLAIRDNETGVFLFLGRILDPSKG